MVIETKKRMIAVKLKIYCVFVACSILFICTDVFAQRKKADYFLKPQAGIWFGPVTPVFSTADDVDTALWAGGFVRFNVMSLPLKVGFDSSYEHFKSEGVKELTVIPVYGNLLWRLPFDMPIAFQLKAGAGSAKVTIKPENQSQWDPLGMLGFELSFPAGKWINIGLRIDYLFIYEEHIEGARKNGHIINTGLTLYLNIGI